MSNTRLESDARSTEANSFKSQQSIPHFGPNTPSNNLAASSAAGLNNVSIAASPRPNPTAEHSSLIQPPSQLLSPDFQTPHSSFSSQFQPAQDPTAIPDTLGGSSVSSAQGDANLHHDARGTVSDAQGDNHSLTSEEGASEHGSDVLYEEEDEGSDEDVERSEQVVEYEEDEDMEDDEDMDSELGSLDKDDRDVVTQSPSDPPSWLQGGTSVDDAIEL